MISPAGPADRFNRAYVDLATSIGRVEPGRPARDDRELFAYRIAIGGAVLGGVSAFSLISAHDAA